MHHALLAAYRAKNLLPYAAQLADDSEHHAPLLPRVPYRSGKPKLQRQRGQEKLRKRSYSCSESPRFVCWLTLPSFALAVPPSSSVLPRDLDSTLANLEIELRTWPTRKEISSVSRHHILDKSYFLTPIARLVAPRPRTTLHRIAYGTCLESYFRVVESPRVHRS
jgi:hypothetical protein